MKQHNAVIVGDGIKQLLVYAANGFYSASFEDAVCGLVLGEYVATEHDDMTGLECQFRALPHSGCGGYLQFLGAKS